MCFNALIALGNGKGANDITGMYMCGSNFTGADILGKHHLKLQVLSHLFIYLSDYTGTEECCFLKQTR